MQRMIVGKFYLSDAGNSPDRAVAFSGRHFQPYCGARIKRDAAAARVENKIERIGIVAYPRFECNYTASKKPEGKFCDHCRWRGNELLLSPDDHDSEQQDKGN